MPPQPEKLPDVPTYPAFQPENRLPVLGQLVVSPPASNKALPGVPQLLAGFALTASPQLSHFRFESFDALRCYSDLQFAVQSKAEELTFPSPPRPALGGVHLQSQMLLNPVLNRGQRPFRRCLTVDVNVTVIRISAVGMPPLIQFLVERVQIDIGQQRRQRSALRRTLLTGYNYPVLHRSPPQVLPNQPQYPFVPDRGSNPAHHDVVIDVVEELCDVNIHHPILPSLRVLLCGQHGILCFAPRPKPMTVLTECRIEDRRQHL